MSSRKYAALFTAGVMMVLAVEAKANEEQLIEVGTGSIAVGTCPPKGCYNPVDGSDNTWTVLYSGSILLTEKDFEYIKNRLGPDENLNAQIISAKKEVTHLSGNLNEILDHAATASAIESIAAVRVQPNTGNPEDINAATFVYCKERLDQYPKGPNWWGKEYKTECFAGSFFDDPIRLIGFQYDGPPLPPVKATRKGTYIINDNKHKVPTPFLQKLQK